MALYDFICSDCGHIWEVRCSIAEGSESRTCPECSSTTTQKYFGNTTLSAVDPIRLGRVKVPDGFREVLKNISNNAPGAKGLRDRIR